jgi:predicted nucleic-acid-binding protein
VIGLDTNVLVRYMMQDDARQAASASALMEALDQDRPGFVSLTSLVELVWVLSSAYGRDRAQVSLALESLLRTAAITVERNEIAWRALRLFSSGSADFADCLIAQSGAAAGCESTVTFDRAAARDAGMVLLT